MIMLRAPFHNIKYDPHHKEVQPDEKWYQEVVL